MVEHEFLKLVLVHPQAGTKTETIHLCEQELGPLGSLSGHVIICGAEESFVNFVEQLRRCDPMPTPIVVLHPVRPAASWAALKGLGPVQWVRGEPSSCDSLRAARAEHSRALAYLAHSSRPSRVSSLRSPEPFLYCTPNVFPHHCSMHSTIQGA